MKTAREKKVVSSDRTNTSSLKITYDYEKVMKEMGIDTASFRPYTNSEDFARQFIPVSILKSTSITFTTSL